MKIHDLKTLPKFFRESLYGIKTFTIRKNDRDFEEGDYIKKIEVDVDKDGFGVSEYYRTGRTALFKITYILTHEDFPEGIPEDYVIMSYEPAEGTNWRLDDRPETLRTAETIKITVPKRENGHCDNCGYETVPNRKTCSRCGKKLDFSWSDQHE